MGFSSKSYAQIIGANDRINMAVIGIGGRGGNHISSWGSLKDSHNVQVITLCDADEKFFAERSKIAFEKTGVKPTTEWDMRKVFDNHDIHAVSIATPNHWHAFTFTPSY
jgi:predicted dehydrogenase